MNLPLRPSGIPAVGDLPWGSHFCQFYGDRDDLVDSLVPYFKAGLENNEHCLWVTSEPFGASDARTMLRDAVPDLEQRMARGQIEIIDHRDWYMQAGSKSADEVLQGWVDRHGRALSQGYAGLRLTGNTYWLERQDWSGFVDYEARVTDTFKSHNIIGMCSYCLDRCVPMDVLDVVRNHQFALIRQAGEWGLIESASMKSAKAELHKLNAELEQRVRERTAELQLALQMREEFLSVASHELKTPITSLQLYMENLLRANQRGSLTPDKATPKLLKAQEQCRRLENLINKMLDVSRASASEEPLPIEPEEVDLAEVARSVGEVFVEGLQRAGCELRLRADHPAVGHWDRMRLEQVVTNLLSNAIKYAPGAPVELAVHASGDRATLVVRDGGSGIPEEAQQRVFERFVQLSPKSHAGGFGLGLWIVRSIVDSHGGSIHLASRPGEGTTFTVELPSRRSA
ncbi:MULTISPECIES: MEDS domain-containing protein [unclassified Corallococcus]|uniref:MEDS domain-containing protein n=1 Tax=unclassified Corallococcus TaxID=2685029 RepID=UPI001A8D731C|nr:MULTISPECIES: MEDS domain-containing protein [unclassified Corallococcus]MBN9683120.1 MEDS domain-containing protein [Corallococcus sp. NCSPR001]WAS85351.1 MEDS domain-containing protein [Corallococcus sp. NCRR]